MIGIATGMQMGGIGFLLLLATGGAAFCLLFAAAYVFSEREGRLARLKTATKRLCLWWGMVLLMGTGWSYYLDVEARAAATEFDTVRSDNDGGIYTARYAYLMGGRILLRVYRTSDMALLAERTYWYGDIARLVWTKHSLIYNTGLETGGEIRLPPSLYDRLTAQLP